MQYIRRGGADRDVNSNEFVAIGIRILYLGSTQSISLDAAMRKSSLVTLPHMRVVLSKSAFPTLGVPIHAPRSFGVPSGPLLSPEALQCSPHPCLELGFPAVPLPPLIFCPLSPPLCLCSWQYSLGCHRGPAAPDL
jgi:hypothetical protein